MSDTPQWIELGYIAGAFGIRGEVRVHLHGDVEDSVLFDQPQCWVKPSTHSGHTGDWQPLQIAQIQAHGQSLIMRFRAIQNRDQASDLQGYIVALPREAFPEQADEDTFYWVDLIGCEVLYDPRIEPDSEDIQYDAADEASEEISPEEAVAVEAVEALGDRGDDLKEKLNTSQSEGLHLIDDGHGHLHAYRDEDVYDTDALLSMGVVREVSDNGVHAILHVCRKDAQGAWCVNAKGRPLDQLIPFVTPIVPFVDIDLGLIITNYPPEDALDEGAA